MAAAKIRRLLNDERPERALATLPGSVRTITMWTFERLRQVEHQADSGMLRGAAQVCEWLLTDERVAGSLGARTEALFGLTPTFEASGDGRRSNRAIKALEAGEDWWEAYPEHELDQLLTWGILLGVAPGRHYWRRNPEHGNRQLPYPEFWHPESLQWDWQSRQWTIQNAAGGREVLVPGDGTWLLHTPYGQSRPWARGLWRSLKRWVLLKYLAQEDLSRVGEAVAKTVVTSPEGASYEQRVQLAEEIMEAGQDAAIVLAYGYDAKMLQLQAGTQYIYDKQVELANEAIAIRIRGGNLTTQVDEKGSRAAAEVHERGDDKKLAFDAESLTTTIRPQSLRHWAFFNFGDPALAPWPKYPTEPEEDRGDRATMVKTLGEGLTILDKLGFEIDEKKLTEEFGLTFISGRKSEEERAKLAQQNAPPKPNEDPDKQPTGDDDPPGGNRRVGAAESRSARAHGHRLASGAAVAGNEGFLEGQQFLDRLVEGATADVATLIQSTTDAILEELDAANGYDDLLRRLRARYADMSAEDFTEFAHRVEILAGLAGHRAVTQDGAS